MELHGRPGGAGEGGELGDVGCHLLPPRAIRICERYGFITYGEFHLEYDGLDYYRMERVLGTVR